MYWIDPFNKSQSHFFLPLFLVLILFVSKISRDSSLILFTTFGQVCSIYLVSSSNSLLPLSRLPRAPDPSRFSQFLNTTRFPKVPKLKAGPASTIRVSELLPQRKRKTTLRILTSTRLSSGRSPTTSTHPARTARATII